MGVETTDEGPPEGTSASPGAAAPASADSRYRVLGEIARGGMGAILEVYDPSLRRTIAMKVVRSDPQYAATASAEETERNQSRLLSEAQILAQLDHPGVVSIHELGQEAGGRPYFTMKRVHGHDFGLVIRSHRAGDPAWRLTRAVGVLVRVCEALAYAHQKGVIHRDLKPANLMVGRFGEVFVMDWGLARVAGRAEAPPVPVRIAPLAYERPRPVAEAESPSVGAPSVVHTDRESSHGGSPSAVDTQAGSVVGTPGYMAPEQARAESSAIGPRTDVYALGAILYHLLAGRHPYAREAKQDPSEIVLAILAGPPEPLVRLAPRAPEELVAIAEKAMARAPEQRYPGMLALAEDLNAWLEGRVVHAHRSGAWAEACKWVGRNRGAAAAILAVVLGLTTSVSVQALRWRDQERAHRETHLRVEALRREDARNRVALAAAALSSGEISHMRELLAGCPSDLRGFEWRHLWRESDTSARTLEFAGLDLKSALFLADGRELVVAGGGTPHRISVHDVASGAKLRETLLEPECAVNNVSLSADGRLLAAFVHLGDLRLYDARDGRALATLDARLHGWHGVAFGPRGTLLAAYGTEGVELWEAGGRTRLGLLAAGQRDIADVAWTPDGERLFAASWDGSVSVWDVGTRSLMRVLHHSAERLQQVECSPDGRWLAGGNWDSRVLVWDACTLELVQRSDRLEGQVLALAWSPDSTRLAVGGGGAVVRLFEAGTWECLERLVGETGRVNTLCFAVDGKTLVSGSSLGSLRFWDLEHGDGRPLLRAQGSEPPAGVAFAPDGTRAAVGWQSGVLEIWDTRRQLCLQSLRPGMRIRHLDWSRDGTQLALADWEEGILLLEPERGTPRTRIRVQGPTEVHFAPRGTQLAATAQDGRLRLWSLPEGALAWEQDLAPRTQGWPGALFGASWSPDGSELVSCNFDGTLEVRDARTGARLRASERPGMLFAQFAPDGARILVWAYAGNRGMELLDARTLAPLWTSQRTSHMWPVLSPCGKRVFSANWSGFLGIWDASTGTLLTEIEGLPPGNPRLGVAPDGDCVLLAAGKYVTLFDGRE